MISKVDNELNTIIIDDQIADKVMVVGKERVKNLLLPLLSQYINSYDENKKQFFVSQKKKLMMHFSSISKRREGFISEWELMTNQEY